MYVIKPPETLWNRSQQYEGQPLPEGFSYTSDNNTEWLDLEGIKKYIAPFEELYKQGKLEG
jgi:UDP-N-acetylglucosamine 4,6-dehydratase